MNRTKNKNYSDKIKWRIRILWGVLVLMLLYMVVIGEMGLGDSRVMSTLAENVSRIIFFGGIVYVITRIIRYQKILKSRLLLSKQQKAEAEERQQFLHDKSGGIVMDIQLLAMLFTTCTTALYNMTAFHISLAILAVAILLKLGSYLIYSKIY